MSLFRNASIRRKQVLVVMLTVCAALMTACAGFVLYEMTSFRRDLVNRMQSLAEIMAINSVAALDFNDARQASDLLSSLHTQPEVIAARIYNREGNVFAQYDRSPSVATRVPPVPAQPVVFTENHLLVSMKMAQKQDTVGTLVLVADMSNLSQRLWRYLAISLAVLLSSLLASLIVSTWLSRLISDPILSLAKATHSVTHQTDFSVRVSKESNDELGQLIDDFNAMLHLIQERDVALQEARSGLEHRVQERTRDLEAQITERKRAEEMLREQFERTNLLNQIARGVAERRDLGSIFNVMLRYLESRLEIDFGGVYLLDISRKQITVASHGPASARLAAAAGERTGDHLQVAPGAFDSVLAGELMNLSDTTDVQSPAAQHLARIGLKSAVVAALTAESRPLGILIVGRQEARGFSAGQCEFLRMVCEHVSLAARQAQLHKEIQNAYDELRNTQQAVLQQERLRALGQMASGIAHDINNALSPVLGFADLLLDSDEPLSADARDSIQRIRTAARDIARTVERMREFYRHSHDAESLVSLVINAVVQQAIDLARPRWRDIPLENGIVINLHTELSHTPNVLGCESEIRQALVNLIINAVDAMPEGGTLTVRTRHLPGVAPDGKAQLAGQVQIEVGDTGVGMDEETRRRCIEPFFSTKGPRGTGMGLAMVYGMTERHEGRLDIDSQPGKGTTIRLIFPAHSGSAPAGAKAAGDTLPPSRIVCIDDDPVALEVIARMLRRLGHTVSTACEGTHGLTLFRDAAAQGRPFEIVVTDLGMPGMDGRLVAAQLRKESPATPIILLTGWGMFLKPSGEDLGDVDVVLSKPPTLREIREGLVQAVSAARRRNSG
jgi:signal transduction histidine kinase/ActR/RegA family two-component response regulator/uncharacterized membrane protein affecting hemolysin expression